MAAKDGPPILGDFMSPASLWVPSYVYGSAWIAHAPFLFWLIEQHRPASFVELGTHLGYSYFAACEAVKRLGLGTRCSAVDHWRGDEHAGAYDESVYRDVRGRNEAHYGDISRLIRARFADALPLVEDGTVDLLHIDGRHFYEDVKADFADWQAKLSERGIVLFHDISVVDRDFGVHRLWAELQASYPTFAFEHGHGLGVLCAGDLPPGPLGSLFGLDRASALAEAVRGLYSRLGSSIADRRQAERTRDLEAEISSLRATHERLARIEETTARQGAAHVARLQQLAGQVKKTAMVVRKARKAERRRRSQSLWVAIRRSFTGSGKRTKPRRRKRAKGRRSDEVQPSPPPATPPTLNRTETRMKEALALGRSEGWLAAEPAWRELWDERPLKEPVDIAKLNRPLGPPDIDFEDVIARSPRRRHPIRWCIYTTLFGGFDTLQPPLARPAGLTCICFSDHDVNVEGWTTIRVPSGPEAVRAAKRYKMLPFEHLSEFDASLFVDANTLIHGDIRRFIERWCIDEPLVMWRHADRTDLYDEAEVILIRQKADPLSVLQQVAGYEAEGVPRRSGLVEAGFIWRRHDHEPTRRLMKAWHEETERGSPRDQLSLCYLMWKTGLRPKTFPTRLGVIRRTPVTSITRHYPCAPDPCGPAPGATSGHRMRRVSGAKRAVTFLYEPEYATSGSTVMRGRQLSKLVAQRLGETFDVAYRPRSAPPSGSIVILTKGCLARLTPAALRELRTRNVGIVADFVDGQLRRDLLEEVDVVWSSSISAHRALLLEPTAIVADMVPHHVDPRVRRQPRREGLSVGYFGELVNAVRNDGIERIVRFHAIDTRTSNDDWLAFVGMFPMHYALRPGTVRTAHKPFLKGFTAARCEANILVDRSDGDALFYLGNDYPYLADDASATEALRVLEHARSSFGSDVWRYGLEIMRYVRSVSSDDHVAAEVSRSLARF